MSCCPDTRPCRTCAPERHACTACGATVIGCHSLRLNSGRACCADCPHTTHHTPEATT